MIKLKFDVVNDDLIINFINKLIILQRSFLSPEMNSTIWVGVQAQLWNKLIIQSHYYETWQIGRKSSFFFFVTDENVVRLAKPEYFQN